MDKEKVYAMSRLRRNNVLTMHQIIHATRKIDLVAEKLFQEE